MSVTGFLVNNEVQKYDYESLENYNTPDFSTSSTYQVGDYVMYQGKLYKCITEITTGGAWDSTKWSLAILSDDVADLKNTVNNVYNLSSLVWVLGTLTPGTGAQTASTSRIVSPYIKVSEGEKIVVEGNTDCLIVYGFDDELHYISDSTWTDGNVFTVQTTMPYIRILIRKNSSNATISESEVAEQAARCSIWQKIPTDVYNYSERFISTGPLTLEIGAINNGIPSTNVKNYVRPVDFVKANKGDMLTITPSFTWASVAVYLYSANTTGSYLGVADFPATLYSNRNYSYVFKDDCYFKFRAANANYSTLSDADLKTFEDCTVFTHYFNYTDFTLDKVVSPITLDYDAIASTMGDFNIAIQTDTHMSKYTCFGVGDTSYPKSDFGAFKSALLSVQKIGFDCYANLGDIVRGYPADTDWEARETFDTIAAEYENLDTNKLFVIGNHDDGCEYYYSTTYNDKRSIYNVLYPSEQFNRITKYGKNQGGILNYYFADINNVVRIITLYQRDFNYNTAVPQIESFAIGSTQLGWLQNTALNTELPVIVLTHAPLITELYANGGVGFADAVTTIQNFKQNGGTVIAVLSGHKHAQASATVDGINHIVFANGYTWFEKVSIDFANRQIKCTAINKTLDEITMTY
jgi:predicted MPP superfamily phosphohydrolase